MADTIVEKAEELSTSKHLTRSAMATRWREGLISNDEFIRDIVGKIIEDNIPYATFLVPEIINERDRRVQMALNSLAQDLAKGQIKIQF